MSELDYMRPVDGSGQTLAVSATTAATFATAVPPTGVSVVAVTFKSTALPATPSSVFFRIGGSAAAANTDYPVTIPSTGDCPTIYLRCGPGDKISVYSLAAGVASCCWMTT